MNKKNHESSGEAILGAFQRIRIVAAFAKVDVSTITFIHTIFVKDRFRMWLLSGLLISSLAAYFRRLRSLSH